jgi:molecular chaperone HtpG
VAPARRTPRVASTEHAREGCPRRLDPRKSWVTEPASGSPSTVPTGLTNRIMTTQIETHRFEAEVAEVLRLVVHSLYSHKEIFLRELISNASDALDKLRHEALTTPGLMEEGESLGIAIEADPAARTLRIADNGIGMDREELTQNLGRIASSGTRRYLAALAAQGKQDGPDLIGQFGVGFYSAFMVAKEVVVETRKAGTDKGYRWRSDGQGEYSIEEVDGLGRGTVVELHLASGAADTADDKADDDESDDAPAHKDTTDFTAEWTIRELVRRYSDFVEYPIQMEVERTKPKLDDDGKPIAGERVTERVTETLNSRTPLWARPKDEITKEEHAEFYRHLTHDWNEPFETLHLRAEGTLEYTALLYLPSEPPFDLYDPARRDSTLSLYVRRVMVQRESKDLLPGWLRFVRGVVESNDLPLNVSRETLQDDPRLRQIKKHLTRKVLEALKGALEADRARYQRFYEHFGPVLKEGIWFGEDDKNRVSSICLFQTTHGEDPTTLAEYVARLPEGLADDQNVIYALPAADRKAALASPHLEALRAEGREVLLMVDPVDEWVLQRLHTFDGRAIKRADKGEARESDEAKQKREAEQAKCEGLFGALQTALAEDVSEVRFSARLRESAAVLVGEDRAVSAHVERLMKRAGQEVPRTKRVLELNPNHTLVQGLARLYEVDAASPRIADYAELLHGQALLTEGGVPRDTARFTKLLTELMTTAVR